MSAHTVAAQEGRSKSDYYTRWWHRLTNSDLCKRQGWLGLPAAHRAMLRRCASLEDVMLTEAFQQLWLSLPDENRSATAMELAALIAWSFAVVEADSGKSLARAMAQGVDEKAESPRVSRLRFEQLLAARNVEEFARRLRRTLKQIKGEVDLYSLSRDIQNWYWQTIIGKSADRPADRQTLKWAMDYYQSLPR
jgi:CRISPR system Cascade subunit CasB